MEEIEEACRIACVDEVLERLPEGYETEMGQGGVNVSGGQKQRICIARALLKKPKILILDDSTSAVDTATEAKIRERMGKALPDMTKIIIGQRISSVRHADQIIILDQEYEEYPEASPSLYGPPQMDVFTGGTSGVRQHRGQCHGNLSSEADYQPLYHARR